MTEIDFHSIRPLKGSQNTGFEELCCQLAALEPPAPRARFFRKEGGGGDAGVEGYWQLSDGREWAWQSKYFFTLGASQWVQLDDSVRQALVKHPQLAVYVVCLPIDLSDRREGRTQSQKNRWDNRVVKWQKWATERGMAVDFRFWGSFELRQRLTSADPRYSGRTLYWFNTRILTPEWFRHHFEVARDNLGPRYTPECHVELPIGDVFHGLCLTSRWYENLQRLRRKFAEAYQRASSHIEELKELVDSRAQAERLTDVCQRLSSSIRAYDLTPEVVVPLDDWRTSAEDGRMVLSQISETLWELRRPSEEKHDDPVRSASYYVNRVVDAQEELARFINGNSTQAAAIGAVLITGEAGIGKSHLVCDIADTWTRCGWPAVLLLGQHFQSGNPWDAILSTLDLRSHAVENVLGALDAAAQVAGVRALILIDALNEGFGQVLWKDHLPGMIAKIRLFPRLAIAVSCRDVYVRRVISSDWGNDKLVQVQHHGFEGLEFRAADIYLANRGIERPSTPAPTPEFSNPLFLKTICDALQRRGQRVFPKGLTGIKKVFDFYLDSLEDALRDRGKDDTTPHVRKAMISLSQEFLATGWPWTSKDRAAEIINTVVPHFGQPQQKSLLHHLISEGALIESVSYDTDDDIHGTDNVRFAFERFSDHMMAENLLTEHVNPCNPKAAFASDAPLGGMFLFDKIWAWSGLVHAMSIQVPERFDCELISLLPKNARSQQVVYEGLIESIAWRDPTKVTEKTRRIFNVVAPILGEDVLFNTVLRVATEAAHPFNALTLHKNLMQHPLPDRDAWWAIYLARTYDYEGSPSAILVNWAWVAETSLLDDERIELAAIALTWFLTTSHRELRDRATKALVSLLLRRPAVLERLLERFNGIDDFYVSERLYAAAYGIAMHCEEHAALASFARKVYQLIFADGHPPTHILWRDYARGIIEVANWRGCLPDDVEIAKARPPYASDWPLEIPLESEIKAIKDGVAMSIVVSTTCDDFSHYIMPTVCHWSITPLTKKKPQTVAAVSNAYLRDLKRKATSAQMAAFQKLRNRKRSLRLYQRKQGLQFYTAVKDSPKEHLENELKTAEEQFLATLSEVQRDDYRCYFRYSTLLIETMQHGTTFPSTYSTHAVG